MAFEPMQGLSTPWSTLQAIDGPLVFYRDRYCPTLPHIVRVAFSY